jgi:hypothetical protein
MPWKNDPQDTTPPAGTFEIPQTNHPWFHGVANSSPKSALSTTTPELIRQQAAAQQKNTENKLGQFGVRDVKP